MKNYLEFINEENEFIPFLVVRSAFNKKFPTKESYEKRIVELANEQYWIKTILFH